MAIELTKRPFTSEEFHRMAEAGILGEDDRVELIQGEIINMNPLSVRHAAYVDRINDLFQRRLAASIIRVQGPILLRPHSEPLPDVSVLRFRADFYSTISHPTPADILLLVEVMDSSAGFDQRIKLPLYAEHKIVEVWLVDLDDDVIHVHRDPAGAAFRDVRRATRGETISPAAFADVAIGVNEILG